jgi:hypothetical protein
MAVGKAVNNLAKTRRHEESFANRQNTRGMEESEN